MRRATAVTWAPASVASWMAKRPTPPLAPVTSTRLPSTKPPISSARSAVSPATGSVAACANEIPSGSSARYSVGTAARSAHAPDSSRPTTRAPSARAAAVGGRPAHRAREIPARDRPGLHPLEPPHLAAVEADRVDGDERLVRQRLRISDLGELGKGGVEEETRARIGRIFDTTQPCLPRHSAPRERRADSG